MALHNFEIDPIISKYYVYVYLDPRCPGQYTYCDTISFYYKPRYIGYGHKDRWYSHVDDKCGNKQLRGFLNKIINLKFNPKDFIIKLVENINVWEAKYNEMFLISIIGRKDLNMGPLFNHTNGGDGGEGNKGANKGMIYGPQTKEHSKKIGDKLRNKPKTKEHIVNIIINHADMSGTKNPAYGTVCIHNPLTKVNTKVKITDVEKYIDIGWLYGTVDSEKTTIKRKIAFKKRTEDPIKFLNYKNMLKDLSLKRVMEGKHQRAVSCIINGIKYPSVSQASKAVGITRYLIKKYINEKRSGFEWSKNE